MTASAGSTAALAARMLRWSMSLTRCETGNDGDDENSDAFDIN